MTDITTLVVISGVIIGFGLAALLPMLVPSRDDEDDTKTKGKR